MEIITTENTNKSKKEYPMSELILEEYTCEVCGMRYEFCICSEEK